MKKILVVGFAAAALVALVKCGKKSDDSDTSSGASKPVATLSVTCGGTACVGTEGK